MPQHHVRMGLLDPGMAGVEVDIDMVDLAARRGEIIEALVLVGQVLDREHVDRADECALVVVGEERTGGQGLRVDIELAEPRQEVGQLHEFAHLLVGAARRGFLDLIGGQGRHGEGSGKCKCGGSEAKDHDSILS